MNRWAVGALVLLVVAAGLARPTVAAAEIKPSTPQWWDRGQIPL